MNGGGGGGGRGRGRGTRFDDQAAGFDRRAGLGAAAGDVAAAVLAAAGAGPGSTVLELGPGTGEIGIALAAATGRYVGLDLSRPMLEAFVARARPSRPPTFFVDLTTLEVVAPTKTAGPSAPALLVEADGNTTWPVRDAGVDLVFSSRAAHLLDTDHVAGQVERVTRPGGHFLLGRVQRSPDSLRSQLRDKRRALLTNAGVKVGSGRDGARRLLDTLSAHGAAPVEPVAATRWTVTTSATEVIGAWAENPAMGGAVLAADTRAAIIGQLRTWAEAEFGPLHQSHRAVETYVIEGVQLR